MMNFTEALDLNEKVDVTTTFCHPNDEEKKITVITYPLGTMKSRAFWPLYQLTGIWSVDEDSKSREAMN